MRSIRLVLAFAAVLVPAVVAPRAAGASNMSLGGLTRSFAAPPAAPAGYVRWPAVSATHVAFVVDDDVWVADRDGSHPRRLTSAPGREARPAWSPDGTLLAYTSQADGNDEVHVIGADGGAPRRLTIHPAADHVLGWTPDGDVIFRSRRATAHGNWRAYRVSPQGGPAREIPVGDAALLAMAPDGDTACFDVHSQESSTWKRYQGGWSQDLWIGKVSTGEYRRLTRYPGNDAHPAFWGDRVLFLSDRDGTANLWSVRQDGTDLRQHSFADRYDARSLSVHVTKLGGAALAAWTHGADLWTLELPPPGRASEAGRAWYDAHVRVRKLDLPTDLARTRVKAVEPGEALRSFALSPDGRRLALGARGEIATVPVKEGRTVALTGNDAAAHQRDPAWSPDGARVVFVSDAGGEDALWIAPADGTEPPRRASTPRTARLFAPAWSPDGRHVAVATSDQDLLVVDVDGGETHVVDRSEAWEIDDLAWSPGGRYLAYAKPVEIDVAAVFVWDSREGLVHQVTSAWSHSASPAWDPKGRYLYLLSDRTWNPLIGRVDFETILDRMTLPYALVLRAGDAGPFFPKAETDEEEDEDGDDAKPEPSSKRGRGRTRPAAPAEPTVIDWDGLTDRIVPFPVEPGHLSGLRATEDAVLWLEGQTLGLLEQPEWDEAEAPELALRGWSFEDREELELADDVGAFDVTADGKRLVLRSGDELSWRDGLDGEPEDDEDVDLSQWSLAADRQAEWRQIFDEAWRLQREFYWDAGMAGVDWQEVRERYGSLLPRVATRDELNDLIGQAIAELSTSHTYVWGGDLDGPDDEERIGVGLLGADLVADAACDCHRFEHVLAGRNWEPRSVSPVRLPQAGVRDGEYLLAINGRRLRAADDPHAALVGLDEKLVTLTVNDRPAMKGARTVEVETVGDERRLRYLDWVEGRRAEVERLGGGRIGYLHVPDMGGEGLSAFSADFYPQLGKEALIVDVRYNGGGFVSQLLLARLQRRLLAQDRPRRGKTYTYPYRVFTGPLAALCNGMTGSDGDIFSEAFQLAGLGPVIGTRTWGGVVGIRGDKPFVDGGMTTQPEFAWVEPKRGWDLENAGVEPDVVVENDPASVARGRDPQLETAVSMLLRELETSPRRRPEPPPAPDKSKARYRERHREFLTVP